MEGVAILQMQVLYALTPGVCLTTQQLADATALSPKKVSAGACGLIRRSYLERKEVGCYQLTKAGLLAKATGKPLTTGPNDRPTGLKTRCSRTLRDRLWSALRIKGRATLKDLLEVAGADPLKSYSNAQRYFQALGVVGIVRKLPRREPSESSTSNGYIRYQLVRNVGPMAPRLKKNGVLDPNTRTYLEPPQ